MLLQISESRYQQYVAFTQMSAAPSAFLYIVKCAGMLIYDKILLCFLIKCFSMLCDKQKNIKNLKVSFFLGSYHIFVKQSQGAITERLRSFSMHDLRTIQGEEPVGQRPYQTLPEAKRRSKQASEPAGMLMCWNMQGSFINGLGFRVATIEYMCPETKLTWLLILFLSGQSLVQPLLASGFLHR